jgi:hypothetical protein
MANHVDDKINEIINEHAMECEKASVSRNVDETGRRIKDALKGFTALDVLGSGHWEGLYYEAKILALRDAVLEMAKGGMSRTVVITDPGHPSSLPTPLETAIEAAPAPKKTRKAKAAA